MLSRFCYFFLLSCLHVEDQFVFKVRTGEGPVFSVRLMRAEFIQFLFALEQKNSPHVIVVVKGVEDLLSGDNALKRGYSRRKFLDKFLHILSLLGGCLRLELVQDYIVDGHDELR